MSKKKLDPDISCILTKQPNNLLFSYQVIHKAIEDTINENFQLNNHQYIPQTIMSFLSTKNIHLIPSRHVNIDIDNNDRPMVELLAISVNNNQPLFTLSAKPKDLPLSWRQREVESDEDFSDEEAWQNEDPSIYYEMQTHHLFHTQIISANNISKKITRVSYRKKMECPVKLGKWDVYSSKRELVKWNHDSGGSSLIQNTDLRNYKHQMFFVHEYCLLLANQCVYILNLDAINQAQFDILTRYDEPKIFEFTLRCTCISNFFKSYNILDVLFLFNNINNIVISKQDKIMCILHNTDNFKIDFILIPAIIKKEEVISDYNAGPPPVKKRKVENKNNNILPNLVFSMDLNGLLSRLYDVKSLFIHGYYMDVQNECILIVINTFDILCIDKECNLISRYKINNNVFDKEYFGAWWTPNRYIVKIERTLNDRDFLFVIHSASNSSKHDVVIVDGYNFSRIDNGRFEGDMRLKNYKYVLDNRTPCDLSNIANLFPFIY
eukprot:237759_1